MKLSLLSAVSVSGLVGCSLANPFVSVEDPTLVEKRQSGTNVTAELEDLLNEIKVETKIINDTLASLGNNTDVLAEASAADKIWAAIETIIAEINNASSEFKSASAPAPPAATPTTALPTVSTSATLSLVTPPSLTEIPTKPTPALVAARQANATDPAAAVAAQIIEELSGTLNGVINRLGIGALLGFVNPLGTALSNLLISLKNLVDNLLILVKQIVDQLLGGLSNALKGINFGA